jgi:peroxiredoxin
MKTTIITIFTIFLFSLANAQGGYNVGDNAIDFQLKNVDGKMVSLKDYKKAKGFIIVFTCNTCPYAIAYENRIIELNKKYEPIGFPVIAINPNDPEVQPADSYDKMITKSKEKDFKFPYLFDPGRKVSDAYGAAKTPHVYLLSKNGNTLKVEYIGAIDDNHEDATAVKTPYLANAIEALLAGKKPNPDFTKAIGCTVKKRA